MSAQKDGSWIASELFMIDPRYETEHRLVRNDEKRTNEEHTFVYEVSWIPEVGVWRSFLRARDVIPAGGEACTAKNCA